jgi:uncharacterized protein
MFDKPTFTRSEEAFAIELLDQMPAIVLLGARQIGKTTLAHNLVSRLGKPTLYLDLERPSDMDRLREPELALEELRDTCVMIDEVQRMPSLFPILRGMIDRYRLPGRFVLLGSALPTVAQRAAESLAGRAAYVNIGGILRTEVGEAVPIREHWFRGGFPDALLAKSGRQWANWMRAYMQAILERDLPMLDLPANPAITRKLLIMLAHRNGAPIHMAELGRDMELSAPTVARYIDTLERAFLIRRLTPWHANLGKRLVKTPKLYLRDSGMLHYLLGTKDMAELEAGHPALGASWEGFAMEQILTAIGHHGEIETHFYRTQDGSEMDLVLAKGGKPIASVEMKYGLTPRLTKGGTQAITTLQTPLNFIVNPSQEDYPQKANLRVVGLDIFLRKYLPNLLK